MNTYIGVDLGTSAVKVLLAAADGAVLKEASAAYPVRHPADGWSEQDPADWMTGVYAALDELLADADRRAVKGLSVAGQMHGLVALDGRGDVIRPAILWNDGRTDRETAYLNDAVGRATLDERTANIAFAGFTAPKILWMKAHEPDNFARIAKIMLPKDYVAYRLTGNYSCDYSDASGTLLLDVKNRRWSDEMCAVCGVQKSWLPELYESYEVTGRLRADVAARFGLDEIIVTAGAGDNAAAAVGTGTVGDGGCTVSLGTSGTAFLSSERFVPGAGNALHAFCHADGGYHLMGCILSAASCNSWWLDILGTDDHAAEQAGLAARLGQNNVFFLPYLTGERSPHNDVHARGAFIGLGADTDRKAMTLAVLEGVAFALRDAMGGVRVPQIKLCGGGAKSQVWRQILADVLNAEIVTPATEQGPAYGAAILAMCGAGEYPDVRTAAGKIVRLSASVRPDEHAAAYERKYALYRSLYPALKSTFAAMAAEKR